MTFVNLKRVLYIFALSATAFSLPLSVWLLSFFTILTLLAWILDGGVKRIHLLSGKRRDILIFFAFYLVYVLWMLNTSDIHSGLTELRLKLPLVVFPLVTGLSSPIEEKELKIMISSFILGVIVSSVYGVIVGVGAVFSGLADSRTLSPFISHIRLAIMSVLGIFSAAWFIFKKPGWTRWNLFFVISGIWMIIYLFLLLSLTGIMVFITILFISLWLTIYRSGYRILKLLYPLLMVSALIGFLFFICAQARSFYRPGNAYPFPPALVTEAGNRYSNDMSRKDIENGNMVWIYLCESELRREWNKKGSIPYDSLDRKGEELRYTVARYMTSAGVKKDSAGVAILSKSDIINIENGMTNRSFSLWNPWRKKVYEIIWQIDYYRNGGNPSRHSLTQRLEFLKTGLQIFRSAPLTGTGTGDIATAYAEQYEKNNSSLEPGFRLLCHNQFLTFLVSFGIAGTLIICIAFFYPFYFNRGYRNYPAVVFLIIIILSMLGEDTFETHTGITFFSYFYSVFIFGMGKHEQTDFKKEVNSSGKGG
jgi:O-Antigen ligase